MKYVIAIFILTLSLGNLAAQDTLRYMQYNLLDYSVPFVNCTDINNSIVKKNAYLRTIMNEVSPDIVAVNEIGANNTSVKLFLDSVMNKYSTRKYQKATMTNNAGAQTVNMIYYDPLLVKLKSQDVVVDELRDINMYKFYLNTMDLPSTADTIFFTPILVHFKAGNTPDDIERRSASATKLLDYLNVAYPFGNYILSGDMNLYTSAEQAWQTLTGQMTASHNFFDPANQNGNWSGNAAFTNLHTQSTHSDNNGCHASGGMNDRFDFVLVSGDMLAGSLGIKALAETYKSFGQDGLHLDAAINGSPLNTAVPPKVLEALYGASDHLPVILDFHTNKHLSIGENEAFLSFSFLENPAKDMLKCRLDGIRGTYAFEIVSIYGQLMNSFTKSLNQGVNTVEIPLTTMKAGMYLLKISNARGNSISQKFIVAN